MPMRNVQMSSINNTEPFARKTKRLKAIALSEMPLPMPNLCAKGKQSKIAPKYFK